MLPERIWARERPRVGLSVEETVSFLERGDRFVDPLAERWFVIEGIDLAWATVHEQEDHAFRSGGKVRGFRSMRVLRSWACLSVAKVLSEEPVRREKPRERQARESGSRLPEKLAAGTPAEGARSG